MTVADVKKNTEQKMQKSIDTLKADLAKVRTGRAHAGILDHVQVDYYGTPTHISQVANITLLDARTIGVQPWEKPMVAKVEKAIRDSDLGLNPATQGELVRVPMPALTEERRRELIKVVKHEGESAKVAIRNLRRDSNKQAEIAVNDAAITEDDFGRLREEIDKLTKDYEGKVNAALEKKTKEIMEI